MASKSKLENIRKDLIDTYGDVPVIKFIDRITGKAFHIVRISDVFLGCRDDINRVRKIVETNNPIIRRTTKRELFPEPTNPPVEIK